MKVILSLLIIIFVCKTTHAQFTVSVDESNTDGLINNCVFFPFQFGIGYNKFMYLIDGETHCIVVFTLIGIEQRSAAISLSGINSLKANYGLQMAILGSFTECNYGIVLGFINAVNNNYGLEFGILNLSRANLFQVCGVNLANRVRIGIINVADYEGAGVDIGIFNANNNWGVQIGLLNYNENALIPWFPLFNFSIRPSANETADESGKTAQ